MLSRDHQPRKVGQALCDRSPLTPRLGFSSLPTCRTSKQLPTRRFGQTGDFHKTDLSIPNSFALLDNPHILFFRAKACNYPPPLHWCHSGSNGGHGCASCLTAFSAADTMQSGGCPQHSTGAIHPSGGLSARASGYGQAVAGKGLRHGTVFGGEAAHGDVEEGAVWRKARS